MQESVISPKYLFQHPMYRVHPRQHQHYQEVRHVQGSLNHPLSFERRGSTSANSAANSNSTTYKRSVEDFERDLRSELRNFKEAVTKLGRGEGASDDGEDDCTDGSSN